MEKRDLSFYTILYKEDMGLHLKIQVWKASVKHEAMERIQPSQETYKTGGQRIKERAEDMKLAKETNEEHSKISNTHLV